MIIEHWLVFLVLLVLLLNDTSMFSDENYWTADFVLVGVSLTLVLMLGGRSIFEFFKEVWRLCFSGGRAVVRGEVSRRNGGGGGQVGMVMRGTEVGKETGEGRGVEGEQAGAPEGTRMYADGEQKLFILFCQIPKMPPPLPPSPHFPLPKSTLVT